MHWRTLSFFVLLLAPLVPLFSWADPVCVSVERANLRKGPGTQFPVSWTVGQFMPLNKIDQKGAWYKVEDLDREVHWISSSMVSTRFSCVVVRRKIASLRQGAGSGFPVTEPSFADKYTPFKKTDRDGAWIQVEDEYKGKFWVNENQVWIPVMRARISF